MRGPRIAVADKPATMPPSPPSLPGSSSPGRRPLALAAIVASALLLPPALVVALVPASAAGLLPSVRGPVSVLAAAPAPAPVAASSSSSSPNCLRGRCSPFSFDAAASPLCPDWMALLPDAAPLTSLSIPGTHDTMTYGLAADVRLQCQNWNLSVQLDAGLRYFDVRARLRHDELRIYHADGDTGYGFAHVLLQVFAFLDAHPSEAVVMRLKEEGPPVGGNNSLSFEQAFNHYRLHDPRTAPGAARHLRLYDGVARREPIPTFGALRSSIFLLQEFAGPDAGPYGLTWDGPQMALEDDWVVPDIYHLPDKWVAIRGALERAATEPLDNTRLYLAHVSASVGVLPVDAAAGPSNRSVTGMNDMTAQWLLDFDGRPGVTPRTGIVAFDFPGRRAIDAVLAWNKAPSPPVTRLGRALRAAYISP